MKASVKTCITLIRHDNDEYSEVREFIKKNKISIIEENGRDTITVKVEEKKLEKILGKTFQGNIILDQYDEKCLSELLL